MRQIKFRAWDYQAKRMVHGLPRVCVKGDVGTEHGYTICDIDVFDGRFVLMQFTGLKDSNGKEIYEGDVVKTKWQPKATVTWIDDEAAYGFRTVDEIVHDEIMYGFKNEEMEVIGNVFENPELLK